MTPTEFNTGDAAPVATSARGATADPVAPGPRAQRGPGASTVKGAQLRTAFGLLFLAGALAATTLIAVDAASQSSPLVPRQPHLTGYLGGLGSQLGYQTFVWAVLAISVCYAGACLCARQLPVRVTIGVIIALHVVLFAGPVLFSQDVFQYLDYARLGAVHGINPFTSGPSADRFDPVFRYVGFVWHHVPTAYGPVFTLLTYPLALLGVAGALWGLKAFGVLSSLAALWLVWLCAKRLGRNPLQATLLVGLNPLWLIYGLGGYHNDLMMDAFMLLGVYLSLRGEEARGATAIVIGAAVKATAAAVLPFMLLGHRKLSLLWGMVIGLVVIAVISLPAFGVHPLDFVSVLRRDQGFVSNDSFPNEVAHLLGFPGVFPIDRTLLTAVTAFTVLYVMWRTWKGYDWLSGAAVALLLLAVTTTWLLPWYLLWALPLCVLCRDRRVMWATLFICALFIAHQTGPLFTPKGPPV